MGVAVRERMCPARTITQGYSGARTSARGGQAGAIEVGWWASLPRSGCTPQPRVAQRTLGTRVASPAFDPEAVGQDLSDPFRVEKTMTALASPGCAARPWAAEYNPFGVKKGTSS